MPTTQEITARMRVLAKRLDYHYNNLSHLSRALYSKKEPGNGNYQNDAMATLGDAVLKLVLSEHFFSLGMDKDAITERKADLENNATLKALCDTVGIQDFAYNDTHFANEAPPHLRLPHRDHDFYMEAIIAAIYLDKGLAYTKKWVLRFWRKHASAICRVGEKRERGC